MEKFKVIIVEDVPLELKGTEGILRNDIPEAEIIGTAASEQAYWRLIKDHQPDLVLLDLGLGGSTTVGVEICRQTKQQFPAMKVLIFTGEVLNEKLWVDALDAGADGISLKSGELLTHDDVMSVMGGKRLVFNQPILKRIVDRFKESVGKQLAHQEALVGYEIDEYDERFLRHLALGYTKDQIAQLRGIPFGVKSLRSDRTNSSRNSSPRVAAEAESTPRASWSAPSNSASSTSTISIPMSETPSAERHSRAKAIYGLAVFLLVTAHGLVLFLSWLIKAVRPDWPLRPLLSEEGVRWLFGHFTDNLLSPLLVWLLLGLCAVSALRGSHLPGAIRRLRSWPTMAYRERLALRSVLFEVVLVAAVLILLTVPSHAILLNVSGSLYPSSFSASIFAVGCLTVITASLDLRHHRGRRQEVGQHLPHPHRPCRRTLAAADLHPHAPALVHDRLRPGVRPVLTQGEWSEVCKETSVDIF